MHPSLFLAFNLYVLVLPEISRFILSPAEFPCFYCLPHVVYFSNHHNKNEDEIKSKPHSLEKYARKIIQ